MGFVGPFNPCAQRPLLISNRYVIRGSLFFSSFVLLRLLCSCASFILLSLPAPFIPVCASLILFHAPRALLLLFFPSRAFLAPLLPSSAFSSAAILSSPALLFFCAFLLLLVLLPFLLLLCCPPPVLFRPVSYVLLFSSSALLPVCCLLCPLPCSGFILRLGLRGYSVVPRS